MFVKPGEGAVEGAAPVNNNGGIATNAREGPTNLFLETSTNVTKERSPITWALERTTCRVPTDGGRSSGPGSGEAPRPTSLLGQRPAPSGSADERTREGRPFAGGRECAPCSRGRRPPAWLRPEGLPRSGSGSSSVGGERARPAAPTRNCRGRGGRGARLLPGLPRAGAAGHSLTVRGLTVRAAVREVAEGGRASPPSTRLWTPEDTRPGAGPPGGDGQGAADRTAGGTPSAGSRGAARRPARSVRAAESPRGAAPSRGRVPAGGDAPPPGPALERQVTRWRSGEMNWSGSPAR